MTQRQPSGVRWRAGSEWRLLFRGPRKAGIQSRLLKVFGTTCYEMTWLEISVHVGPVFHDRCITIGLCNLDLGFRILACRTDRASTSPPQLATRLVFASALRAAVPAQKPGSVMRIRPGIWVRFVILPFKGHCWQEFAGAQPAPLAGLPRSFEQIGFVPSPSLRPQLGSFRHFPYQAPRVWRTWPRIRP